MEGIKLIIYYFGMYNANEYHLMKSLIAWFELLNFMQIMGNIIGSKNS